MESSSKPSGLSFGGLASGLKTDEIVPAMVDKSRGPLRKAEQHHEILGAHHDLLETVHGVMSVLGEQAHLIDGMNKFVVQRAISNDEHALSATAGAGAMPGNHRIEIRRLAQAQKTMSVAKDAADTPGDVAPGTLRWQHNGQSHAVEVAQDASLRSLAAAINRVRAGVSARVVYDGSSYRLQLDGSEAGAANALALQEEGLGLGLGEEAQTVRQACDASFCVDGHLEMTRPGNVVHDAIEGVTLLLEQDDVQVIVRVLADPDAMMNGVVGFVDSYNTALDAVDLASKPGRDFEKGRMVGDASLRNMHRALQDAVTSPVKGLKGPWHAISEVGITSTKEGRLRIDAAKLREALRQNPQDVARLFVRDRTAGTKGVAIVARDVVDHYTMPLTGVLPSKMHSISKQRLVNEQHMTQMQTGLEKYESHLREQFSNLERNMTKMKQQKDFLEQQVKQMSSR